VSLAIVDSSANPDEATIADHSSSIWRVCRPRTYADRMTQFRGDRRPVLAVLVTDHWTTAC
jgi:hypothetical protein